ncbi:MAG: hypothetical protein LBU39_03730 [Desulfobulbaceae bacterium]|jgi:hypothetical protein|nr:hypothetical protein [Desulfobulbaceae bacterium]
MEHGRYFRLDDDAATGRKLAVFRYRPDGERDSPMYVAFDGQNIDFFVVGATTNSLLLRIPLDDGATDALNEAFKRRVDIPEMADYAALGGGATGRGYCATFFAVERKGASADAASKRPRCLVGDAFGPGKILTPLAKMALDFLFDLHETHIFEMSPHYGELRRQFDGNFLCRALAAKAAYLYWRVLYGQAVKKTGNGGLNGQAGRERREFYGERLFQAEKRWTDCIRDSRSDKTFHDCRGWFADNETELIRVFRPLGGLRLSRETRQEKRENDRLVSKWLIARYSGLTAWRLCLGGNWTLFGSHMLWPRIGLSVIAAWVSLILLNEKWPVPENLSLGAGILPYVFLLLLMIFAVSLMAIRRVAPFADHLWLRALGLVGLVLAVSTVAGRLLLVVVHAWPQQYADYLFLWISASFIGLVLQIVLQGDNPSEPF